jgi:hypothetical protein
MAVVAREYTDEQTGREVVEYESGAVQDKLSGKLVSSTKPLITADNARDMVARRIAKAQQQVRKNIVEATNRANWPGKRGLPIKASSSAEAVGIAAGVLWETGVLDPDARLADRVKAFESVSKAGQLMADTKQSQAQPTAPGSVLDVDALERTVAALEQARRVVSE